MIELKFSEISCTCDIKDASNSPKLKHVLLYDEEKGKNFVVKVAFASYSGSTTETLEFDGASIAKDFPLVDSVSVVRDYHDFEITFSNTFSREIYRKQFISNVFLLYYDMYEKRL